MGMTKVLDEFREWLMLNDKSELTVKAYIRDIKAYGIWLEGQFGAELRPENITPIDVAK
jgi:hypothetical protein